MERVLEPTIESPVTTRAKTPAIKKRLEDLPKKLSRITKWKEQAVTQQPALHPEAWMRQSIAQERPAWIPDHITENWETDPYAYQTEDELMPVGIVHGRKMVQIGGMIESPLEKKGFLMLYDMFMMYRREDGKRDRIGPDILIISGQTEDELGSSYDTETQPTPVCAFELVSPKGEEKDLRSMRLYLEQLEIPTCVMIYLVDDNGFRLPEAKLTVWRRDGETGQAVQAEEERRTREAAEQQAAEERHAREVAEQKNAELLALLQKHGISI